MRDLFAVFVGALIGSAFSFSAMLLYIAAVRRVGRRVFQSWLILLWFPVHVLFAVTLVAPMFSPFFVLGIVGASFPLPDTLTAVAIILGILGLVALVTYFFRQWHHLQRLGYLPPQRV